MSKLDIALQLAGVAAGLAIGLAITQWLGWLP